HRPPHGSNRRRRRAARPAQGHDRGCHHRRVDSHHVERGLRRGSHAAHRGPDDRGHGYRSPPLDVRYSRGLSVVKPQPQERRSAMKRFATLSSILAVSIGFALPAQAQMKDMDMKDMHKGMDMKGMDSGKAAQGTVHKGTGVVKKVDAAKGAVTLDHEPIKSVNWSAMTMTFAVKDKKLLDKLESGKKVEFEFVEKGKEHV